MKNRNAETPARVGPRPPAMDFSQKLPGKSGIAAALFSLHIDKNAGASPVRLDAELFRFGGQLFEQHFGGNRAE